MTAACRFAEYAVQNLGVAAVGLRSLVALEVERCINDSQLNLACCVADNEQQCDPGWRGGGVVLVGLELHAVRHAPTRTTRGEGKN